MALALKKQPQPPNIVGIGRNAESLQEALSIGLIDQAETNVESALTEANMVLIATPVAQTPTILRAIRPFLTPAITVTDAGSTKSDVVSYASAELGEFAAQFVGGHPIAGAEKSGPAAALADLYTGKNVILTPTIETQPLAVKTVEAMWKSVGAIVSTMTPEQHDGIFAAVSHLPHMLAFALVDDLARRDNAETLFKFAASGFRDFTRIAGSHPEMWRDISLANKTALLSEISAYQAELAKIKQLIENEDSVGLEAVFEKASLARNQWAKAKLQ